MKLLVLALAVFLLGLSVRRLVPDQEPQPEEEKLPDFAAWARSEILEQDPQKPQAWRAFLERPTMTCGIYRLKAGATDGQSPHDRDEVYYVMEGKGRFTAAGETRAVAVGDVLFVAARAEHRFHDITDELVLLVFFSSAKPKPIK